MGAIPFSLEGILVYLTETFTAGVIESYRGQGEVEDTPLRQRDILDDFIKFDQQDTIFQEYDPPPGDDSKLGWKRSRPTKWSMSIWKTMKYVFYIQIVGGWALGSLAILILMLELTSNIDLCFEGQYYYFTNWTSVPRRTQAVFITVSNTGAFYIELLPFIFILVMFGWGVVKKLNLLTLNLLGAFLDTCYRLYLQVYGIYGKLWMDFPLFGLFLSIMLMNSLFIGREVAANIETTRSRKINKAIRVSIILAAQFAFGLPLAILFQYVLIPWYENTTKDIYRALMAGALPLVTAIPKIIVRLAAQRIDFLHPGESHVLVECIYFTSGIIFRVMQAEINSLQLFVMLSFSHGAVDLLERLTIVVRDYFWYFVYKKLKREGIETVKTPDKFRTPRSMRLIADMSIQMILGESTALITAVAFIQLYNFSSHDKPFSLYVAEFFSRVSIALSIDFVFNSLSFWLQMSYLNVAVVRVWKKKWRKHMLVAFILTTYALVAFTTNLLHAIKVNDESVAKRPYFNCTGTLALLLIHD